ncbi:MAG TPA: MnmC family methyltransferase, partial [Polyangiales bacterium]
MAGAAEFELIITASGARALRDVASGEVMHAGADPRDEARVLYLEPSRLAQRLCDPGPEPLLLLDVGLGAGTNAALALRAARTQPSRRRALHVLSFDLTLAGLELALAAQPADFGLEGELEAAARTLHTSGSYERDGLRWSVCLGDLRSTLASVSCAAADVVYWDPFSPRATPELWSVAVFQLLQQRCRARATLHTYSAATATRSALLLAGFSVGKGPGLGTKQRHSTQAALCAHDLAEPLSRTWLQGLAGNAQALPSDAPPDALR